MNKNIKKKILVLNTAGLATGGITTNMYNYLSRIIGSDICIDIVVTTVRDDTSIEKFKNIGCRLHFLPNRQTELRAYSKALYQLCRNEKYDAIHIHGSSRTLAIDLAIAYAARRKMLRIVHAHNTTCDHIRAHKLLAPLFHCLSDVRLACGEAAGHWMYGDRIFLVIPNAIDTDSYKFDSAVRQEERLALGWQDNFVIGHVGFFSMVKNQSFIIDVFHELYQENNKYRLMLMGDGELRQQVEQKVKEFGLQHAVLFTGKITDTHKRLSALDLVIMPSLYEGLPLVLIEQQANGLNIVLSDTISKETDKTGNLKYLSLKDNISIWTQAVKSYVIDTDDERKERSKKAIEDITKAGYNIDTEVHKLRSIYLGH